MKNKIQQFKEVLLILLGVLPLAAIIFIPLAACLTNFFNLLDNDFKEPYKEEIIRGVGIPFAPLGMIIGVRDWMGYEFEQFEQVEKKD